MYKQILAISFIAAPILLRAQTADDYFHGGAQYYIFGEKQKSKAEIVEGLNHFPNDPKLQQMAGLLKKEEKKDQKGGGQQNQRGDQDKDQQSQNQQGQGQDKQNQQSQDNKAHEKSDEEKQQEKQQQANQSEKKDQQQAQNQQGQASDQPQDKSSEEAQREAAMMAAGQMTPKQAEQLLDSQKDDDHVLQLAPPNKNVSQSRSYKDW